MIIHCPYCHAEGLYQLKTALLNERAEVVYCGACGSIYGVLPAAPPSPKARYQALISQIESNISPARPLSPGEHCPNCKVPFRGVKLSNGKLVWLCPRLCGEWRNDAPRSQPVYEKNPLNQPRVIKPRPVYLSESTLKPSGNFSPADLGYILGQILRQPVKINSQQTQEMTNQAEQSPPSSLVCPTHIYELIKLTVPSGLRYGHRSFWVCPSFRSCHHWFWVGEPQPA